MCCDWLSYWLALHHVCQLIQFKKWTFSVFYALTKPPVEVWENEQWEVFPQLLSIAAS